MKNMEAFIAYRHTGESMEDLEVLLGGTRDALARAGVNAYCTFFDDAEFQNKAFGARQIMQHAFEMIDTKDMLFVIQTSENKSEGMIMEVGYCIAKGIPIVVAVKNGVQNTYLPDMADLQIQWDTIDNLHQQIEATNFTAIGQ